MPICRVAGNISSMMTSRISALLILTSIVVCPAAAQMSDRHARVEVVCPKEPIPVSVNGQTTLVYELHVTNFGRGALELRELAIDAGAHLATYRDSALAALLQPAGAMEAGSRRLDPGMRTIVFLWLSFPKGPVPRALSHRFVFGILDTADVRRDQGTESSLDSVVVRVSTVAPAQIQPPVSGGEWVEAGPANDSDHRRSVNAIRGKAFIGQRFALDLVKVGPNGDTHHDDEHVNENYWGFGEPVRAVAAGEVVAIVDSIADHPARSPLPRFTLQTLGGNEVIVRLAPTRYAAYAHLQRGSVRVRLHQRVAAGQILARLGNSGQSTAPHLHFQIADGPSLLGAEGVPFTFERYSFLGWGKDFEETKHVTEPRHADLPADGAVIGLP